MANHRHTPAVSAQPVWQSVVGVLQSCCSPCPTSQAGNDRSPACICHGLGSCSSRHSDGLPVLQAAHRTPLTRLAGGAKGRGKVTVTQCVHVSVQLCPGSRRLCHLISPVCHIYLPTVMLRMKSSCETHSLHREWQNRSVLEAAKWDHAACYEVGCSNPYTQTPRPAKYHPYPTGRLSLRACDYSCTCESIVAGTEGPHIVLTADTAALVGAPQGAAAEWKGHQWVVINCIHDAYIYNVIPAETASQTTRK